VTDVGALNGIFTDCRQSRTEKLLSTAARAQEDFREIFERYARPVSAFLRDLLGDWALAEEMAQETFIRAYRARASKRPNTRISTWLFGIAYNVGREAIREKYRRRNTSGLEGLDLHELKDDRQSPDQSLMDVETKKAIQKALGLLPESQRVVFLLKIVNQMRYQEIKAITGAGIGKLKTDLHRARLEMRRMLAPYFMRAVSGKRGSI
jgi:RNA polymerase sigma-70 factor (ECF subfamily)